MILSVSLATNSEFLITICIIESCRSFIAAFLGFQLGAQAYFVQLRSESTELRTNVFAVRSFALFAPNNEQCEQSTFCEQCEQRTVQIVRTANSANGSYCTNSANSEQLIFYKSPNRANRCEHCSVEPDSDSAISKTILSFLELELLIPFVHFSSHLKMS